MKEKLCLSLDPEVRKALKELADERHMTQAALITFWILEEKKKKQKQVKWCKRKISVDNNNVPSP